MKLSTKGRYAVMAMVDIGQNGDGRTVSLAEIAERQDISQEYLEQLFVKLRKAGLVRERPRARAAATGWPVTADDIAIYDIISAVDEPMKMTRCEGDAVEGCVKGERCCTHDLWSSIGRQVNTFLANVTLDDVVNKRNLALCGLDPPGQGAPCPQAAIRTRPMRIYLDHNATSPLRAERPRGDARGARAFRQCVFQSMREGRDAHALLDEARDVVARRLGVCRRWSSSPSGGTRSQQSGAQGRCRSSASSSRRSSTLRCWRRPGRAASRSTSCPSTATAVCRSRRAWSDPRWRAGPRRSSA